MTFRKIGIILLFGFIFSGWYSCEREMPNIDDQIDIQIDELSMRISNSEGNLLFKSFSSEPDAEEDYFFSKVAEIVPPTINGVQVQASFIHSDGNKLYVSYNDASENCTGALDVLNMSLNMTSTTLEPFRSKKFPTSDINSVVTIPNAADIFEVFLVGASSNFTEESLNSPAFLLSLDPTLSQSNLYDIPGYAANSISYNLGSTWFGLTAGSNGGLSIYDRASMNRLDYYGKNNLSSVFCANDWAYLAQGQPTSLVRYQLSTKLGSGFEFSGISSNPLLKSSVEVAYDHSFLALNDGGTVIFDNINSAIKQTITPDNSGSIDPDFIKSNGLCIKDYRMFVADGGKGLTIFELDPDIKATPIGNVVTNSSVNHVICLQSNETDGYMALACGHKGVQIIYYQYTGNPTGTILADDTGGTFPLFDGELTVDIPAGGLDEAETIQVENLEDFELPGVSNDLLIALEFSPAGLTFSNPITVTIFGSFDPSKIYTLLYVHPDGSTTPIPHVVASDGSSITFQTDHFSEYAVYEGQVGNDNFVIDRRDGKEYKTVEIDGQIWMAENMAYLPAVYDFPAFSDTVPRHYVTGYAGRDTAAAKLTEGYAKYGVLYNHPAAKVACPDGWHLSSDQEWLALESYLGMSDADLVGFTNRISGQVGMKLKSDEGWGGAHTGINSVGFSAMPAGGRKDPFTESYQPGLLGVFWLSDFIPGKQNVARGLMSIDDGVSRIPMPAEDGYSVRCIKGEPMGYEPIARTDSAKAITWDKGEAWGQVEWFGASMITEFGFCWNNTGDPTVNDNYLSVAAFTNGGIYSVLSGLNSSTTYFIRAYATNEWGIDYGDEVSLSTPNVTPSVTTDDLKVLGWDIAEGFGTVVSDGGAPLTERGFCYSDTTTNPTIANTHISAGSDLGAFDVLLSGLRTNTTYHGRAYATNGIETAYGLVLGFTTPSNVPEVKTDPITNITSHSSVSGVEIIDDGGVPLMYAGLCWGTTENPTVADDTLRISWPTASFKDTLRNLLDNTTYYVRAFADNAAAIGYGQQRSFTTLDSKPSVITHGISPDVLPNDPPNLTATTAKVGGHVIYDGTYPIIERGVCWSTLPNPTISDTTKEGGVGLGPFNVTLTKLTPSTKYYVRAYCSNQEETAYGLDEEFTTLSEIPSVTTTVAENGAGYNSISGGGTIFSEGSGSVTQYGLCYNTSGVPTINDSKTISHSPPTQVPYNFTVTINGLTSNTQYYVRAFATNTQGITGYGHEQWVRTTQGPEPSVTTNLVGTVTDTSAVCSGNAQFGIPIHPIQERGICYSTSANPTTANSKVTAGSGTGDFSATLLNLSAGTKYYFRAYATNPEGTGYGEVKYFTTNN